MQIAKVEVVGIAFCGINKRGKHTTLQKMLRNADPLVGSICATESDDEVSGTLIFNPSLRVGRRYFMDDEFDILFHRMFRGAMRF